MSLGGPINQVPSKLVFTNLVDGAELEAQFNPTNFTEQLGANWNSLTIPGASYKPLQFSNTDNLKLRFEMFFLAQTKAELAGLQRARLLLLAWCYPRRVANDIVGGGAPRILVTWPTMLSLQAVIRTVEHSHQRFNRIGQSVHMTTNLSLEEISDVQLTFDQVREDDDVRFGEPAELLDPSLLGEV